MQLLTIDTPGATGEIVKKCSVVGWRGFQPCAMGTGFRSANYYIFMPRRFITRYLSNNAFLVKEMFFYL
jgi:hypothetical protein